MRQPDSRRGPGVTAELLARLRQLPERSRADVARGIAALRRGLVDGYRWWERKELEVRRLTETANVEASMRGRALQRGRRRAIRLAVAALRRYASLPVALFLLLLIVGWLYQVGQVIGYGVPLGLVPPDPGSLVVSAATLAAVAGAVLLVAGWVWFSLAHASYRTRVSVGVLGSIVVVVSIPLLLLGFPVEGPIGIALFAWLAAFIGPLASDATARRDLLGLGLAVLILAPLPVGWLTASGQIASDTGDRVDLVLANPLPGLAGARAGTGCVYLDLVMLHADPARMLVRMAGAPRVWVVPFDRVVSVAASTGVPYPTSGPC
jgi:hypothetical protein